MTQQYREVSGNGSGNSTYTCLNENMSEAFRQLTQGLAE